MTNDNIPTFIIGEDGVATPAPVQTVESMTKKVNPSPVYNVRDLPWANISKSVKGITHVEDALSRVDLNWKVVQQPVYRKNLKTGEMQEIKNRVINIREDIDEDIEVLSNRYTPVQNKESFSFIEGVLGTGALELENAGSFGYDSVFLLGKVTDQSISVFGDKIEPYILLANSHDGSSGVRVCLTPIRVICRNTLAAALHGAPRTWQAKHLGSITGRMKEAEELLGISQKYFEELPIFAEKMNSINLVEDDIVRVLKKMFPVEKGDSERVIANAANNSLDVLKIYKTTPDLKPFEGTAWGFFNAVADWATHNPPAKKTPMWQENRLKALAVGHPLMGVAQAELMKVRA